MRRAAWLVCRTLEWKARLERCVSGLCAKDAMLTIVPNSTDRMIRSELLELVSVNVILC